jgi:phosphatidylserine decarboxylase precursor
MSLLLLCALTSFTALAQETKTDKPKPSPIAQQLIDMVEHNREIKTLLVKSIESARKINPDRTTNPAQTLEEYYAFVDWAARAMPWSIVRNLPHSKLFDQLDQGLAYFYFINDQPLPGLKDRGYYNNSLQYHEPYRTWLIHFVKEWGMYLSREESWNEEYYKRALEDERFGLQKSWYEDPSNWKSFNDFFSRRLKSPGARPIASPEDPSVAASPGDSVPQGEWRVNKNSDIVREAGVPIKSAVLRSVAALIGEESPYKNSFANGTVTYTYLAENDYHRFHFPVGGTIREVRIIPGDAASGGFITWDAGSKSYVFDTKTPGWQSIETRGCVILETEKYGLVALIPVGMAQISSIHFEETVKPGAAVKKGDLAGYFLFGGSGVVMVFQEKAGFRLTVPQEGAGGFMHVLAGQEYGKLAGKK